MLCKSKLKRLSAAVERQNFQRKIAIRDKRKGKRDRPFVTDEIDSRIFFSDYSAKTAILRRTRRF